MKPVEWSLYCDAPGCSACVVVRCSTDDAAKQAIVLILGLERWSILGEDVHRCAAHDLAKAGR